jgi:hypothetical protein
VTEPTREQIAAIRNNVPVRVGSDNMDMAAGWCAAIDTVLTLFRAPSEPTSSTEPLTDEMIEAEVKRRSFGFVTVDLPSFAIGAKWAREEIAEAKSHG